jgi:mono/diheme cytochrome c family protein
VTMPMLFVLVAVGLPGPGPDPMVRAAEHFGLGVDEFTSGRETFLAACVVCHGPRGHGLTGLGKPLRNNPFVQESSDGELIALITNGRDADDPASSSGTLMPPRGASVVVTDERIPALVRFLRTMQEPGAAPADMSPWVVTLEERAAKQAESEAVAVASGLDLDHPGRAPFVNSCSSCHGANGEGMEGLGKPFTTSEFIGSKTDKELMNFVKTGRAMWDPDNTTGVDMPAKGGNPALGDEDLKQIIDYIRAIHDSAG